MKEFFLEFTGIKKQRDDFLEDFHEEFFKNSCIEEMDRNKKMQLFYLLREIIKNIYDHAEGMGSVLLKQIDTGRILFKVCSPGNSYDFQKLKKEPSSKQGNKINFGRGLFLIESMLQDFTENYSVDTSAGFCYQGEFPYS